MESSNTIMPSLEDVWDAMQEETVESIYFHYSNNFEWTDGGIARVRED